VAKLKLENVKVLKAESEEQIQDVKATQTKLGIIQVKNVDHLILACPNCDVILAIPMVAIRLLQHKKKYPKGVV